MEESARNQKAHWILHVKHLRQKSPNIPSPLVFFRHMREAVAGKQNRVDCSLGTHHKKGVYGNKSICLQWPGLIPRGTSKSPQHDLSVKHLHKESHHCYEQIENNPAGPCRQRCHVTEPTEWVNSLIKKHRSLRVCLDPYNLNKAIRRHFSLICLLSSSGKSSFTNLAEIIINNV